jgi:translation elongation factor EF-4
MKAQRPLMTAVPGFEKIKPMVYAGVFPSMDGDINDLRSEEALYEARVRLATCP